MGWNRTGREMGLLAFGLSLGDRDWMDQSPAALNLLDFVSPVRARLRLFNDVSHDEGIPRLHLLTPPVAPVVAAHLILARSGKKSESRGESSASGMKETEVLVNAEMFPQLRGRYD